MIESSLWKILGFILAVVLIFVVPTMTVYDRMDSITYNVVSSEVDRFTDNIRDNGYISGEAYQMLISSLANTGIIYDVSLEHYEKTYIPVYINDTFTQEYEIIYNSHFNDEIEAAFLDSTNNGKYKMKAGDMFYINVENKAPTKGQTIRSILLNVSSEYPIIVVRSGGMIRHESD